jgi:hypothetical protein
LLRRRCSIPLLVKTVIVAVIHVVAGVFFYYGRVKSLSPIFDSDVFVFLAPALLAFGGYLCVMWPYVPPTSRLPAKIGLVILVAFVATIISCGCIAIVAFNTWGT